MPLNSGIMPNFALLHYAKSGRIVVLGWPVCKLVAVGI